MLEDAHVIAFAATADPDLSRRFYEETLGLELLADDPFALVFDAGGTMLRLQKTNEVRRQPYTTLGWRVPDLEARVLALKERGVVFERYATLDQDRLGIWTAPDGARIAWFKDPDGQVLSLTQF